MSFNITNQMNNVKENCSSKIILLGDSSVGKSSIVYQLFQKKFRPQNEPTIGMSYISQSFSTKNGNIILHIWDTAGQERYRSIIPIYSRGCAAAIFVVSVDLPESLSNLHIWFDIIQGKCLHTCKMYIVVNKVDLGHNEIVNETEMLAKERGYSFFLTSAKDYNSVFNLFQNIANDLSEDMNAVDENNEKANHLVRNDDKKKCC